MISTMDKVAESIVWGDREKGLPNHLPASASGVHAPIRRNTALSWENASSLGEKSGEEEGRKRS